MNNEEMNYENNQEVHSNVVRAGKRTYFFDIKATRNNDLYLTITESKKVFRDGNPSYQKHKIFLYKEDFEKFQGMLTETFEKIEELKASGQFQQDDEDISDYTSVDYDDL